jgi:hypothetical protein
LRRAFAFAAAVERRIGDAADREHTRSHRAYDDLFPGQRHKACDPITTLHQHAAAAILATFIRHGPNTRHT